MAVDHGRYDRITETYTPGEGRSLSEAVISAVETHTRTDPGDDRFVLYDGIDPDALDALFRDGGDSVVSLEFDVGDVRVHLRSRDGSGVDIRVGDRPGEGAE